MTYGIGISKAERAFLGCNGDDRKYWMKHLGPRLSLRRATESTNMEDAEAPGEPLPARRTMLLDKTIFSTACRVAAGRIDARLFRMRAELADAGQSLALDLYQADTSKQCRILLTEEDLVTLGLEPCTACPNGYQADDSRTSATSTTPCSGQSGAMTGILTGPGSREAAVRQLTRHLCFAPESDSIVLSIDGSSRITAMVSSTVALQRRPQSTMAIAFSQARSAGLYAVGRCSFVAGFLKQRHQPCVLLHGLSPHRTRQTGKRILDSTPRCDFGSQLLHQRLSDMYGARFWSQAGVACAVDFAPLYPTKRPRANHTCPTDLLATCRGRAFSSRLKMTQGSPKLTESMRGQEQAVGEQSNMHVPCPPQQERTTVIFLSTCCTGYTSHTGLDFETRSRTRTIFGCRGYASA